MMEITPTDRPFSFRANTGDEQVIQQIFHDRDYDLARLSRGNELVTLWRANSARGKRPLIIDAGANIGAASVWFHHQFPNAMIFAIEPDQGNFGVLTINSVGLPILCFNGAVTSRPGLARVANPGRGNWGFQTEVLADGELDDTAMESIQIDRIFNMYADDTYPFIVKIDIEGAEEELFSRDVEWLQRVPLVIIELHDWLIPKRRVSGNFLRAISGLDRDFVHIGENIFSIDNAL